MPSIEEIEKQIQEIKERFDKAERVPVATLEEVEKMIQQIEERLNKADIEGTFLTCQALRKAVLG